MKTDDIKGLSDNDLLLFIDAAKQEKEARDEKRKQETITKIRELAASERLSIHIDGTRGRPPKQRGEIKRPVNGEPLAEKAVRNGK